MLIILSKQGTVENLVKSTNVVGRRVISCLGFGILSLEREEERGHSTHYRVEYRIPNTECKNCEAHNSTTLPSSHFSTRHS